MSLEYHVHKTNSLEHSLCYNVHAETVLKIARKGSAFTGELKDYNGEMSRPILAQLIKSLTNLLEEE